MFGVNVLKYNLQCFSFSLSICRAKILLHFSITYATSQVKTLTNG